MKGMDGSGAAHKPLLIRLSKKVHVFMTDEYRSTKACLVCQDYDLKMKYLKGNDNYYNNRLKKECNKHIHGLSHCKFC